MGKVHENRYINAYGAEPARSLIEQICSRRSAGQRPQSKKSKDFFLLNRHFSPAPRAQ